MLINRTGRILVSISAQLRTLMTGRLIDMNPGRGLFLNKIEVESWLLFYYFSLGWLNQHFFCKFRCRFKNSFQFRYQKIPLVRNTIRSTLTTHIFGSILPPRSPQLFSFWLYFCFGNVHCLNFQVVNCTFSRFSDRTKIENTSKNATSNWKSYSATFDGNNHISSTDIKLKIKQRKQQNWKYCSLINSEISHKKIRTWIIECVLVISRTHFKVNPHSIVAWMSRTSLLEAGAIYEV